MTKKTFIIAIRIFLLTLVVAGGAMGQLIPNLGGQRAGISAYQFLKIGVGARAVGLGESFIAIEDDASALYWNPAGLVQFNDNQVIVAHAEYVVDIKHEFFGSVYHLSSNDAVGVSVTSLHMDEMPVTTETQPFGNGRYFSFGDIAVGLSYSKRMTDQFSFGVTFRYVEETLDILKMRGMVADLGTYYITGLGSSRFAVVVSNFGADVAPSGEVPAYLGYGTISSFQSFSPPTQFKLGFAMEPMQTERERITTSIELNHPNDNAENVHLGVEYQWDKWLCLRVGLKRTIGERLLGTDNSGSGDFTGGFGLAMPTGFTAIKLEYAYAHFNALGSVHRISLGFSY